MHFIIVGCGRVGSGLALTLSERGHTVCVIDKLSSAFRRLPEDWPGQKLVGFGFDKEILEEAGAERAYALAAVTNGDNSNILTARIAKEHFAVPNVVARIYDPRRAEIYQRLGIPTVATVSWTISQVLTKLLPGAAPHEWVDPTGEVVLTQVKVPEQFIGKQLSEIEARAELEVVGLLRGGRMTTRPSSSFAQQDDILFLLGRRDQVEAFLEKASSQG
jgi:trk system potassium uptake protein TrkA